MPALHIEEVIVEAVISSLALALRPLRRIAEELQGGEGTVDGLGAADPALLDPDRIRGQREANRRDAGKRTRWEPVRSQAVDFIGGIPEELEGARSSPDRGQLRRDIPAGDAGTAQPTRLRGAFVLVFALEAATESSSRHDDKPHGAASESMGGIFVRAKIKRRPPESGRPARVDYQLKPNVSLNMRGGQTVPSPLRRPKLVFTSGLGPPRQVSKSV